MHALFSTSLARHDSAHEAVWISLLTLHMHCTEQEQARYGCIGLSQIYMTIAAQKHWNAFPLSITHDILVQMSFAR